MKATGFVASSLAMGLLLSVSACAVTSDDSLASDSDLRSFDEAARVSEASWIIDQFEVFYAPLELKETNSVKLSWAAAKTAYLDAVRAPNVTPEEFEDLTLRFVAKFKDAHTGAILWRDYTKTGTWNYSTLGFQLRLERDAAGGSKARVEGVYSAVISDESIKAGDELISIDGRSPDAILADDVEPFHDTGNAESNRTFGYRMIALRPRWRFGRLPSGAADVVIDRAGSRITLRLPWVTASYEALAGSKTASAQRSAHRIRIDNDGKIKVKLASRSEANPMEILSAPASIHQPLSYHAELLPRAETYAYPGSDYPSSTVGVTVDGFPFTLMNTDKGLVAIYRIEDFVTSRLKCSTPPNSVEQECMWYSGEDYAKAFNALSNLNVKALVLDMRSNGGGYLFATYELLRAFAATPTPIGPWRFRLNTDWLASFRPAWYSNTNLAVKSNAANTLVALEEDEAAGLRISRPSYFPKYHDTLQPTSNPYKNRVFVLADEGCASACDLTTTALQDSGIAKVFGMKTMGAGGTVESVGDSPRMRIALRQTTSLFYRADGVTEVENNGANPDRVIRATPNYFADVKTAIESEL
jgi:hypothetical protein